MTFASSLRLSRLTLLATLLGLNLSAQAAPATVSFDTTPRAGQHQRQTIDMQAVMRMRLEAGPDATEEQRAKIAQTATQMSQTGPVKMALQMQQVMKVGMADTGGWLPVTVSVSNKSGTMEVGGRTTPLPKSKTGDLSFSARFNPKDFSFDVQQFDGGSPELKAAMGQQATAVIGEALQLYKALSQRPLKIGESVDVPFNMALPMPMPGSAGNMQSTVRYTLVRVANGVAHFDLAMDLKMDINTPLPRPAAAASAASAAGADAADAPPPMMQMVISGSGKGSSSLRLADRLQQASRLSMNMKMTMNGPDNGRMLMEMDMDMQSKGESLAKPAAKKKP
ncbi:MAG TPA: hypothetical protein VGF12_05210 [Roseateles sp.]|uniref:hypothetical protein n=1 Tax=Roseateles sp. TaxID=1971397 RepID=UPI002ED8BE84